MHSRQFTGRIVTVTNDKVFDCPVYNYTHQFAYIWDEISIPVAFHQDFARAEAMILRAANGQARTSKAMGEEEVNRLEERFGIDAGEIDPKVFWRITQDWMELTVRFLGPDHGIRHMKDQMTREVISGFEEAGLLIAATRQEGVTLDVVKPSRAAPSGAASRAGGRPRRTSPRSSARP